MTHDTLRYDPDVGYTFLPGIKARVRHETGGYLVAVNSLGFRSGEVPEDTRGGVFVFGDSFTAGDGVSNGTRWSDELERLLPGTPVHNFGLPGTGTDQQYLAWRKFAAARACRLLIVAVLVENVRRNLAGWYPFRTKDGCILMRAKPYFRLENGELVLHHQPVPTVHLSPDDVPAAAYTSGTFPGLRQLANRLGVKDLVQQLTHHQPVPDYEDPNSDGWRLMSAILERWCAECRTPIAIVPLPLYPHIEGTADARGYQARFRELGARTARPIIDILPELRAYDRETRRRFRFGKDPHPTPDGHRAIARAIASQVTELIDG